MAKLIRKGDLTSTGKRGASLNREQVEALAGRRAAERAAKFSTAGSLPRRIRPWTAGRVTLGVRRPARGEPFVVMVGTKVNALVLAG